MSNYETDAHERTELSDRAHRALEQYLTVLEDYGRARGADDLYMVVSQSGKEYLVDARDGVCECPDFEYRCSGIRCKHLWRVAYATGDAAIPTDADVDVDPQLGEHIDASPRADSPQPVATDGGITVREAVEGAEVLEDTTAYELDDVDGGVLVFQPEEVGRRLVGFTDVDDWSAIRSELIRRGIGVGAIHHLEVFEPEEVGR